MEGEEFTLQLCTKLNTFPELNKCFVIDHSYAIIKNCIAATRAVAIISNW